VSNPVRVLFLCTGNSARSIIAEAVLRELGGDAFDVSSAGTQPKGVNPHTVQVLAEHAIDVAGAQSRHVDAFTGEQFDYVITVCDDAAERCPVFPGQTQRMHWSFADPAAIQGSADEKLAAFRETVRAVRERVTAFVPEALAAAASGDLRS
jgi:arsenate reductase